MLVIAISFLTTFFVTHLLLEPTIRISLEKNICDIPGHRSSHKFRTPILGGFPIFAGIIISVALWIPFNYNPKFQYLLCALTILFLVGLKDDVEGMLPSHKLIAQIISSALLVLVADIRLTELHGFLNWSSNLPYWFSIILSLFVFIVIINGFNLIDGINGLASGIVILVLIIYGIWFYLIGQQELSVLSVVTFGATLAFLRYNVTPARIFMGDTGSLILGMTVAVLTLEFIEISSRIPEGQPYYLNGVPTIAIGLIFLPLFDTFRVFIVRLLRGLSPLNPDRRHIHHLLIDYGFSHMQATKILVLANFIFIILVFVLQIWVEQNILLVLIITLAGGFTFLLHKKVNSGR